MTKTTYPHHYLCRFTESHGEYEMTQYCLLSTETEETLEELIDMLLQTWWGDYTHTERAEWGDEYWMEDGAAKVEFEAAAKISAETFNELKDLMPCNDPADLKAAIDSLTAHNLERALEDEDDA